MITILSFIPEDYIKLNKNSKHLKSITLFSSIKMSILPQTYTNWELFLVTNVQNVDFESSTKEMVDPRIKIVYTPDSYLNLNSLYNIDDKLYNSKCRYISIFDLEHDVWNINKLQFQYDVLDAHNCDVVGCECSPSNECVDSKDARIVETRDSSSLFHSCPFLVSTILMKKKLFTNFCSDTASFEKNVCNNDNNFILTNTLFNTTMAQFHSLLLFMTLREYKYVTLVIQRNKITT